MRTGLILQIFIISVVLLTACGSVRPPVEKLSVADQLLQQAKAEEAGRFAPVELNSAAEKLAQAKFAMEQQNFLQAERLADRSAMDARTAIAIAGSIKAQMAVDELKQSNAQLQKQLEAH